MRFHHILALAAGLGAGIATEAAAADPSGLWLTAKGEAKIRVSRCGSAICGRVAWLRRSIDSRTGERPVDAKNPDPSRRERPILGLRLFGMTPAGPDKWTGPIYNAQDGEPIAALSRWKGRTGSRSADAWVRFADPKPGPKPSNKAGQADGG